MLTIIGAVVFAVGLTGAMNFGIMSRVASKKSETNPEKYLIKASRLGGAFLASALVGILGVVLVLVSVLNF